MLQCKDGFVTSSWRSNTLLFRSQKKFSGLDEYIIQNGYVKLPYKKSVVLYSGNLNYRVIREGVQNSVSVD